VADMHEMLKKAQVGGVSQVEKKFGTWRLRMTW
jgi:hypothetical protein